MSYCVNCGVELAKGEKKCPLCDTEVINPRSPYESSASRPYPERLEKISKKIDKKYFALLAGVILLIPIGLTMLCDIIATHGITWSIYVAGAGIVIFVAAILPFYFKKYYTVRFLAANGAAILLYLKFIEKNADGNWFLPIGLPITVVVTVITTAVITLIKKKRPPLFVSTAIILLSAGIMCVCIDIIIKAASGRSAVPIWSSYVMFSCLFVSILALILEKRKRLKEEIKRRLFF